MLLQNYRAYDDIVEVPSHLFYQDTLVAKLKRPSSLHYSVVFYGVHGQEEIADEPPSFLNRGEAAEVTDRVEELISNWPSEVWGEASPSRICVLAPYPPQVKKHVTLTPFSPSVFLNWNQIILKKRIAIGSLC